MNKARRKLISKAVELMGEARALLGDARDGEQDCIRQHAGKLQASRAGVGTFNPG
jgi:hypothetical protein